MERDARVRVARDERRRMRELARAERELELELTAAIRTRRPGGTATSREYARTPRARGAGGAPVAP